MKRRRTLVALFVLMITSISLIIILLNVNKEPQDKKESKFQVNSDIVYNQGQSLLEYKNYLLLKNDDSNSIVRYDIKNNLYDFIASSKGNMFEDEMYIINNKFIYSINNVTYYSDVDLLDRNKFIDGRIVYINDDIFVYIKQEEDLQYLYLISYDNTSFRTTNKLFFNLAKGYKINFIKESNGLLLFSSINSDKSLTLFSVDLTNSEVTLIARETSYISDIERGEIVEAIKYNNSIYYIIAKYQIMTNGESLAGYELMVRPLDAAFSEFVNNEIEPYLFIDNDNLYFGKYDYDAKKYNWTTAFNGEGIDNWIEKLQGNISKYFNIQNSQINFNNQKLVDLNEKYPGDYTTYTIKNAFVCKDNIYILFKNESSYVWFSCKMNGSDLKKLCEFR